VLLSVAIHALLLTLTFGVEGLGRPNFRFPWGERRFQEPDLRLVLVPQSIAPAEPDNAPMTEQPSQAPSVPSAPTAKALAMVPAARPDARPEARPNPAAATKEAKVPVRAVSPNALAPEVADQRLEDAQATDEAAPMVATAPSISTPANTAAPSASAPETETPVSRDVPKIAAETARLAIEQPEAPRQEDARQEAARAEASRIEAERQEAERRESERLAAAQLEAQRQKAARDEAARVEAARQETERLAAAQLEAQRQKAARDEAARVEAARQETERREAERVATAQRQEAERRDAERREGERREAERREAERREAERRAAAQADAPRQDAARPLAATPEPARARVDTEEEKREARLRAIGRQLDEERARREELATTNRSSTLPLSLSPARRVKLWGRSHPNAELIRYSEAFEQKIQSNTSFETVSEVAKQIRTSPMVTVAIRSDGSVESVTFEVSSGVPGVDEAIRRIVQNLQYFRAFPPELVRDYDVIEIRRTWHFDVGVRLY
jgi:TonB family protein